MEKMPVYQDPANKNGMPDRTYKDRLTLLGGNDAIDLYYFGAAHTNGDTFVVFRNRRVLHAGDVFANTAQPLIDVNNGGSGIAYGETIGKAAAAIKNVDTVITGHTDVKKWQDFVDFGEFNRLFLAARARVAQGRSDGGAGDGHARAARQVQGLHAHGRSRRAGRQFQRHLRRAEERPEAREEDDMHDR